MIELYLKIVLLDIECVGLEVKILFWISLMRTQKEQLEDLS